MTYSLTESNTEDSNKMFSCLMLMSSFPSSVARIQTGNLSEVVLRLHVRSITHLLRYTKL